MNAMDHKIKVNYTIEIKPQHNIATEDTKEK
jgi:hypothetical protein